MTLNTFIPAWILILVWGNNVFPQSDKNERKIAAYRSLGAKNIKSIWEPSELKSLSVVHAFAIYLISQDEANQLISME